MKSFILASLLLFVGLLVKAEVPNLQTLTFAWDYPATPTNVVFYLRDATSPMTTNLVAMVTNTTSVTVSNILAGPHNWSVTASNLWGESDPSVPFVAPHKPVTPGPVKPVRTSMFIPVPGIVHETSDLSQWDHRFTIGTAPNGIYLTQTIVPNEPMKFWRATSVESLAVVAPAPVRK